MRPRTVQAGDERDEGGNLWSAIRASAVAAGENVVVELDNRSEQLFAGGVRLRVSVWQPTGKGAHRTLERVAFDLTTDDVEELLCAMTVLAARAREFGILSPATPVPSQEGR